jgi:hypothetical protein
MSGYWEAVVRAALDLPVAAAPVPVSPFEPDPQDGGADELMVADENLDAPVAPDRRPELLQSTTMVADSVEHAESADRRPVEPPGDEAPAESHPAPRQGSQRPQDQVPALATTVPTPAPEMQAEALSVLRRVDRVEVQRVDAVHTLSETVRFPRLEGIPEAARQAPEFPTAAPSPAESAIAAGPAAAREPAAPLVAVAETVTPAAVPTAVTTVVPELPPLIIEIDRVDIRIEPEPVPAAAPTAAPRRVDAGSVPSLSDYLARRTEARG